MQGGMVQLMPDILFRSKAFFKSLWPCAISLELIFRVFLYQDAAVKNSKKIQGINDSITSKFWILANYIYLCSATSCKFYFSHEKLLIAKNILISVICIFSLCGTLGSFAMNKIKNLTNLVNYYLAFILNFHNRSRKF